MSGLTLKAGYKQQMCGLLKNSKPEIDKIDFETVHTWEGHHM